MLKSIKTAIAVSIVLSIIVVAVFGIRYTVTFFEIQEQEFQNVIIAIKQESFFSGVEGKKVNLDTLEISDAVRKIYAKQIERISNEAHQIGKSISSFRREAGGEYVKDDSTLNKIDLFNVKKYRKSNLLAWKSYELGVEDAYSFFCKQYLTCNENLANCNLEFDFSQSFPVTHYFSDSKNADKINTEFQFYAFGKNYSKTIYASKVLGEYDMTIYEGFLTPQAENTTIYTEDQFGSIASLFYSSGFSDLICNINLAMHFI